MLDLESTVDLDCDLERITRDHYYDIMGCVHITWAHHYHKL